VWFLTIFFGSLVVSFSGALMPGPVTITAIERSARGGAAAAAFVGVGHAILELFVTVGLAIGLLSVNAPAAKAAVGMVGGAVLVWMGLGMWKSARTAELKQAAGGEIQRARRGALLAGVVTSLSNPYWFLWWLTIGAGFVASASDRGPVAVAAFYVGHISGDLVWLVLLGFAAAKGAELMSQQAYRRVLWACALLLIAFGALFVTVGVGSIRKGGGT